MRKLLLGESSAEDAVIRLSEMKYGVDQQTVPAHHAGRNEISLLFPIASHPRSARLAVCRIVGMCVVEKLSDRSLSERLRDLGLNLFFQTV
jgi:hypothetical protein